MRYLISKAESPRDALQWHDTIQTPRSILAACLISESLYCSVDIEPTLANQ
jgi:hypothetical protein